MEKTITPKRYNLKIPDNPNKPRTPSIKCPKCNSDNIRITTRRSYYIKLAVCLAVILLCYSMFISLKAEHDIDPVIIIGVLGSLILSVLSFIFGLYYFTMAILTKDTTYKCEHCKNMDFFN